MDKLYEEYGKLMVQSELLNNRIQVVKQAIQEVLNKPVVKEEPKED